MEKYFESEEEQPPDSPLSVQNLAFNPDPHMSNLDIQPGENQIANKDTQHHSRTNKSASKSRTNRFSSRTTLEKYIFCDFIVKAGKNLKKEYVRAQAIRSFKRCIRESLQGKEPKKKLGAVDKRSESSRSAFRNFKQFVQFNPEVFFEVSKTEAGPKTDGKSKGKADQGQKSFNYKFCQSFFANPLVLEAYRLFMDLVFADMSCRALRLKFDFDPNKHTGKDCSECYESWIKLRKYLREFMISDLNIGVSEIRI